MYRTAADDRVREEHAALHGTTLLYDDPFWDMYYPPNGYGCRCNVIQVIKGKYKTSDSSAAIEIGNKMTEGKAKSIFRYNPGKTKKPYPSKHLYMPQGCGDCKKQNMSFNPSSEACKACVIIRECYQNEHKSKSAKLRNHYLREMNILLSKTITKKVGEKEITIRFTKKENKHLCSDTFKNTKIIKKDDLKKLDKYLNAAVYEGESPLTKPRKDNIKYFYYFKAKIDGKWVRLNIGKDVEMLKSGKLNVQYVVHALNDIKK